MKKSIDMANMPTKENAEYVDLHDMSYEAAIEYLRKAKVERRNVVTDGFGNETFSLFNTEAEWWKTLTGKTKEEYLEEKEALKQQIRKEYKADVEPVLGKAKPFLFAEREKDLEDFLYNTLHTSHSHTVPSIVLIAIDYMEKLENGSVESVKEELHSAGMSGYAEASVKKFLLKFSKKGPEFMRAVEPEFSKVPKNAEYINKIENENKQFATAEADKQKS